MEYKTQISKFTDTYQKIIEVTNQLLQEIIEKLPGSYEIIQDVLSKFNVTGKDVIEYATEEATAKWIIAKLQEQLAQAQPPPTQAKTATQAKT
jgi:iron-sulfur cluster repair protein YtfE (RIC family)